MDIYCPMEPLLLILIFLATLVTNFLSLLPPALKGPQGVKVLLQNPAFLIGDFLAIPIFVTLSASYLAKSADSLPELLSPTFLAFSAFSSGLILFLIFFVFKPHKNIGYAIFVPHVMFSILVISILVRDTLTAISHTNSQLFAILLYLAVLCHVAISWVFPKRFDLEKGLVQFTKH